MADSCCDISIVLIGKGNCQSDNEDLNCDLLILDTGASILKQSVERGKRKVDIIVQSTIEYYNNNAEKFYTDTVSVEFTQTQQRFLAKMKDGAYILDFGCGSGRDTRYFLSQGCRVEAVDGSRELCGLATRYTGIKVRHMLFQDLSVKDKYDGIWACSSILHLPLPELVDVMQKMENALKDNGVVYTSFKYGNFSGERNGRFFTDMTEDSFAELIRRIEGLETEEKWVTCDVRPGRGEEKWLNLILRKR